MIPLIVDGPSMEPAIRRGTRVMVDDAPEALVPGAVLCFESLAGPLVVHRLIGRFLWRGRWIYVQAPEEGHRAGLVAAVRVVGVVRLFDDDGDAFRAPSRAERRLARRAERLYRLRQMPGLRRLPIPAALRARLLSRRVDRVKTRPPPPRESR